MKHFPITSLFVVIFLLLPVRPKASGQTADGDYSLFPCFIVNAEAVRITNNGHEVFAELKITEVHYGPTFLLGQTFRTAMAASGDSANGELSMSLPWEKEEIVIWPVQSDKDGALYVDRLILVGEDLGCLPCRRKFDEKAYEEIVELSRILKTVSAADAEKKFEIVRTAQSSKSGLMQRWAAYMVRNQKVKLDPSVGQQAPEAFGKPGLPVPAPASVAATPWGALIAAILATVIGLLWWLNQRKT